MKCVCVSSDLAPHSFLLEFIRVYLTSSHGLSMSTTNFFQLVLCIGFECIRFLRLVVLQNLKLTTHVCTPFVLTLPTGTWKATSCVLWLCVCRTGDTLCMDKRTC